MIKYEIIFLIISSDDLEVYSKMREFHKLYFPLYNEKIKMFFLEFDSKMECEICEKGEYIYVKGTESITPGVLIKTMTAMKYINEKYDYDFLIRSNLSSFWNLNNVLLLKNTLPLFDYCGGFVLWNSFITGTGIILSRDVCINFLNNTQIEYETTEDVYTSMILKSKKYSLQDIKNYKWYHLTNNETDVPNDIENILYYRIKNPDRNYDIELFSKLCKQIYNLTL